MLRHVAKPGDVRARGAPQVGPQAELLAAAMSASRVSITTPPRYSVILSQTPRQSPRLAAQLSQRRAVLAAAGVQQVLL